MTRLNSIIREIKTSATSFLKNKKATAFFSSVAIIIFLYSYFLFGLFFVYRDLYFNFVQNMKSGIPFELMSIFGFDQDRGLDISNFFGRGNDLKELGILGPASIIDPHRWHSYYGSPVSIHAVWGNNAKDKLKTLERYTTGTYPDYLPNMHWVENNPSTGHDTLTLVATRSEEITLAFPAGLIWKNESGERNDILADNIIFRTNIYNVNNIWFLFHIIEPQDADLQFLSFLNLEKQKYIAKAEDYYPGKVDRAVLFTGIKSLPELIMSRQRKITPYFYYLILLPTQPLAWLLFVPMLYVPYMLLETAARLHFFSLIILGTVAVFILIVIAKRLLKYSW